MREKRRERKKRTLMEEVTSLRQKRKDFKTKRRGGGGGDPGRYYEMLQPVQFWKRLGVVICDRNAHGPVSLKKKKSSECCHYSSVTAICMSL
jgi:hypothetical protein